jgi:hypothetical protein
MEILLRFSLGQIKGLIDAYSGNFSYAESSVGFLCGYALSCGPTLSPLAYTTEFAMGPRRDLYTGFIPKYRSLKFKYFIIYFNKTIFADAVLFSVSNFAKYTPDE